MIYGLIPELGNKSISNLLVSKSISQTANFNSKQNITFVKQHFEEKIIKIGFAKIFATDNPNRPRWHGPILWGKMHCGMRGQHNQVLR